MKHWSLGGEASGDPSFCKVSVVDTSRSPNWLLIILSGPWTKQVIKMNNHDDIHPV